MYPPPSILIRHKLTELRVAGGVGVTPGSGTGVGPAWEATERTWRTPGMRCTPSPASLHSAHYITVTLFYLRMNMYDHVYVM